MKANADALDIKYMDNSYKNISIIPYQELPDEPVLLHDYKDLHAPETALNKNNNNNVSVEEETSSCSCRLCDPFCRIWAFPLRRSCSDNTEVEASRQSKNVGVIGGNRVSTVRNEWRSSPQLLMSGSLLNSSLPDHSGGCSSTSEFSLSRKGSFSDSGDSGCDILSGLSFPDDVLLPSVTPTEQFEFKFSPDNAVFSESINEISRKMMESMDLRSCSSEDSGSVFSDSVFSDEFLMSLDSLAQSGLFNNNNMKNINSNVQPNFVGLQHTNAGMWFDQNNVMSANDPSLFLNNSGKVNVDQFVYHHEKDRGDEVINCFDMVWSGPKLLPVKE